MTAPTLTTIDALVRECGHHTQSRTNNGYGCRHPRTGTRDDDTGEGQCFEFSCPLATAIYPESEPLDSEWLRDFGEDPAGLTDEGGWLVLHDESPRVLRLRVVGQVSP